MASDLAGCPLRTDAVAAGAVTNGLATRAEVWEQTEVWREAARSEESTASGALPGVTSASVRSRTTFVVRAAEAARSIRAKTPMTMTTADAHPAMHGETRANPRHSHSR